MSAARGSVALGLDHHAAGRLSEAEAAYREALAKDPDSIDALHFLGVVALQRGEPARAVELISRALDRDPANAAACNNLGLALAALGRRPEAIRRTLQALSLQPGDADALANLRRLLQTDERPATPEERDALLFLGLTHSRANELDEAGECMRRILAANPADAGAHNLLGNVLRNQARHRDALLHYELAMAHDPEPVVAMQNLLFCMMCMGEFSAADLYARHRSFTRRFEQPLPPAGPFANARDARRRLRVGYVSPDFRHHIVGHYLLPILENHDRASFELHAYSTGAAGDGITERLASRVDRWHEVHSLSDDELAARMRGDAIDILVDLCGHGPGNRILVFARKPAPVQVSYLDYSATTGLAAMDYRLTTEYCDPRGAEQYYSEKLHRLPHASYWTYNPPLRLALKPLPSSVNGHVTFGSFNLYYRITAEVLDLWTRVLQAVPRSRLVIASVAPGSTKAALIERLAGGGVAPERVAVHGTLPYEAYHELVGSVDVGLAPFPYNGATTVMDCAWNGVPVVAKAGGASFTTRMGCSVLSVMGLDELIAADEDGYVRIAAELASSPQRLAELRCTLRERLERSPLRDFSGFTRALESAYREMWQRWCD